MCSGLVLGWDNAGSGTWVNVGRSLPPRVNPQVARLGARALVAQGIEHRFPKTTLYLYPEADYLPVPILLAY